MNGLEQGLCGFLGADWPAFAATIRIGVIGAGGLGSNCALHLIRSGFSRLILADPDMVETSNLNRQFFFAHQIGQPKVLALRENLLAVNPDAQIDTHILQINADTMNLFADCQAVVEAVDEARTKKLIVEHAATSGSLVVSASGMGGMGRAGQMRVRALGKHCIVVGDMQTPCEGSTPPLSPGVGMAAAMQADVLLEYFFHLYERRNQ